MKAHSIYTLPNGLRIIHEPSTSDVLYCGYVIAAGTRHELPHESGMAHFIEHMTFKGTNKRRSWQISNGLECVGGELNAFTNKQETVYCATVLRQDFRRAADLLTDIVFHSTYPGQEIAREVEVICDEIDSYQDSPSEIIFDEFEENLFQGEPLGRDILGSAERLRTYTTADALDFAQRYYKPENAVFYVYGQVSFKTVIKTLCRLFDVAEEDCTGKVKFGDEMGENQVTEEIENPSSDKAPPIDFSHFQPATRRLVDRDTHQAHVVLGTKAYGGRHPGRFALMLLNNILGGPGMNARLNMQLRERAGLVYTVESTYSTYPDVGEWTTYFGCDASDVRKCLGLVYRELVRLLREPMTQRQLNAAKRQFIGQIGISRDAHEGYAVALGRAYSRYASHRDLDELARTINALTAEELHQAALDTFRPEHLMLLVYAPEGTRLEV